MTEPQGDCPLMPAGQRELDRLSTELTRYGATPEPKPTLRPVLGLLSYYDLGSGTIYLGVHESDRAESQLMALFLRHLLGMATDAELLAFFRALLPWTIAHELAHCLRHRAGRFGADRWWEEQVAQILASATWRTLPPALQRGVRSRVHSSVRHLTHVLRLPHAYYIDSYADPLDAWAVARVVPAGVVRQARRDAVEIGCSPVEVLRRNTRYGPLVERRLIRRHAVRASVNTRGKPDIAHELFLQLGWTLIAMNRKPSVVTHSWVQRYLHPEEYASRCG